MGTAASLTLPNLLSFAYMQPREVNRISLTCLPAVVMVSSNMSSRSLLISHHQVSRASSSASSAAACRSSSSGKGLQVPAQVAKAPEVEENKC